MFIDTRRVDDGAVVHTGVCIVGGGAAGISLALTLSKHGIDTCILESGGFEADEATRDLSRGESVGIPYEFADGCRGRYFGGSTNCWGGWCRPLDDLDFEKRDWVPYSGWPFGKSELEPHYEQTHALLKLGPYNYQTEFWEAVINRADVRRFPLQSNLVHDTVSQFSPPARMGKLYRTELENLPNVRVFLYANAVEVHTRAAGERVTRIRAATLTGRMLSVKAKYYVLAGGGIENARLLLVSNKAQANGLGNDHDLVGRFFMEHPRLQLGHIKFNQRWRGNRLYDNTFHHHNRLVAALGTKVAAHFVLTPKAQRQEQVLNAMVTLSSHFPFEDSEAKRALRGLRHKLRFGTHGLKAINADLATLLRHPNDAVLSTLFRCLPSPRWVQRVSFLPIVEPEPNPNSRVTLACDRDALGLNRVCVDWRMGDLVKRTFDRSLDLIAHELRLIGAAEVELGPSLMSSGWPEKVDWCWHHMGTTRMHDSSRLGVVNRNCQVHGVPNLYIAGSSVFPTGGANMPTITIVALALRLADHLAAKIRQNLHVSEAADGDITATRTGLKVVAGTSV